MTTGNPNTRYGRRKNRREFYNRYHNEMTDKERADNDFNSGCATFIIALVIIVIVFLLAGPKAAIHYLK